MAEASQEMSEGELFVVASNESDEREPTEEGKYDSQSSDVLVIGDSRIWRL